MRAATGVTDCPRPCHADDLTEQSFVTQNTKQNNLGNGNRRSRVAKTNSKVHVSPGPARLCCVRPKRQEHVVSCQVRIQLPYTAMHNCYIKGGFRGEARVPTISHAVGEKLATTVAQRNAGMIRCGAITTSKAELSLPICRVIWKPIPEPPPVTSATFPLRQSALNGDTIVGELIFQCPTNLAAVRENFADVIHKVGGGYHAQRRPTITPKHRKA